MTDRTKPNDETRAAEREEMDAKHVSDREPIILDQETAAEKLELDPEVVKHEQEMAERGANQKGEGRIP